MAAIIHTIVFCEHVCHAYIAIFIIDTQNAEKQMCVFSTKIYTPDIHS